jgi:hypothetical protein
VKSAVGGHKQNGLGGGRGTASRNPKAEGRKPKEIRNPKPESRFRLRRLATEPCQRAAGGLPGFGRDEVRLSAFTLRVLVH